MGRWTRIWTEVLTVFKAAAIWELKERMFVFIHIWMFDSYYHNKSTDHESPRWSLGMFHSDMNEQTKK